MPVAGVDGSIVRRKLHHALVPLPHVPQLDGSILGDGGEDVLRVWTELDIPHRFRVAEVGIDGLIRSDIKTLNGAIL